MTLGRVRRRRFGPSTIGVILKGISRTANGRISARLFSAVACLALVMGIGAATASAAVQKQVTNQIGTPAVGEGAGEFRKASYIAVNQTGAGGVPPGTFYVVDSQNYRVQRFSPAATFVSAWGYGVQDGSPEFQICTKSCRAGSTGSESGQLSEPEGIAVDQASGRVYVADPGTTSSSRIDIFSAKGTFLGAFGLGAVEGNFSAVLEFCTPENCVPTGFNAFGQGGGFPFGGIGGLAVDPSGDVYVADEALKRIDVIDILTTGDVVTDVAFRESFGWDVVNGESFPGAPGDTAANEYEICTEAKTCKEGLAGTGLGQFGEESPTDVAVDAEGHAYVLDARNHRVQKFSAASAPITAAFGASALEAVFGTEPELLRIAVDPSTEPNHLLVAGVKQSSGKVVVVELDETGANALGGTAAHGEDL